MSNKILDRFDFNSAEDIFWFIGLFLGSLITCLSLFTYTLVIQHLYCVNEDPMISRTKKIEPPFTKIYSTLSATFATLSVLLIFTTYPVCTQYFCGYNPLGNFYYDAVLDTYIAAKLFLYFLFIGRLFNPHYAKIYRYHRFIKVFLFIVMAIVILTTVVTNVGSFFNFKHQNINALIIVWVGIYVFADFILSGFTLVLFFKPLWTRKGLISQQSARDNSASGPISTVSTTSSMSVVLKYGIISSLQTITATLYGISLIVRFSFHWFHSTDSEGDSYLDICSLIQMMDMLITMICIYLGFAKKQTYQQYCEICERYWIACCCNCCSGYQLAMYHDLNWNKKILIEQLKANGLADTTTINTTSIPTTANATTTSISVRDSINDCSMNVMHD